MLRSLSTDGAATKMQVCRSHDNRLKIGAKILKQETIITINKVMRLCAAKYTGEKG